MALIDQQKAIDKFKPWLEVKGYSEGELNMLRAVIYELENLPDAQPEIIHCKDCKRFRKPSAIVDADWGWCSGWHNDITETFVKLDGFCHRAEKRG